jgi:signal transduction histidine kinase
MAVNESERENDVLVIEQKFFEAAGKHLVEMEEKHSSELKELIDNNKKLLAIIGHDLKSPMASIISFLGLLRDGINLLERVQIEEFVDIALISAQKSYNLLDNLLNWAFTENLVKSFRKEKIDIFDLCHDEIENISLIASQKKIEIDVKEISHQNIEVDINMIKTVFRNLLYNALKYTYNQGKIIIEVNNNNGMVQVSVKDNGVGIEKKVKDAIFSKNSYISRIGTKNEAGTGFGLLICKEFIEFHGGKIWLTSEYGKGSEFKFTLPV